jgi:hypothetical protein
LRQRPSRIPRATDIELVIFVVQWSPPAKLVTAVFATHDWQIYIFSQKVGDCSHGEVIKNNKLIEFINGLISIVSNHISKDAMAGVSVPSLPDLDFLLMFLAPSQGN